MTSESRTIQKRLSTRIVTYCKAVRLRRLWKSPNARRETLRIVVLDEKRREEVQKLVSLVYTLAEASIGGGCSCMNSPRSIECNTLHADARER